MHESLGRGVKSKSSLRYTGCKLQEKGVLLEIEDLPPTQLKNVLFEISPLATTGVFQVQVKFVGVAMEIFQLDIQVNYFFIVKNLRNFVAIIL